MVTESLVRADHGLLVRVPVAAAELGVSRSTIYAMISSGELPTVHIGKAIRIPRKALVDWVTTNTLRRTAA